MQNVEDILKSRIKKDNAETFVVIVPTTAARLKRQRELLQYHPSRTVANLRVHTFAKFVQRLYAQLDRPEKRVRISPGMQTLWLRELVDEQAQQAFSPVQDVPVPDSTLSLIVDTINYLKERGTDAEGWRGLASDARNPYLTALTELYEDYQDKLNPNWIDETGMHLFLATQFKPRMMKDAFPGVSLVSVEDFDVLSKADIKLLAQIANIPNMQVYFRTDYQEGNPALFGHVENLFQEIRGSKVITDELLPPRSERIAHFAQNLFQSHSDASSRLKLHEKIKLVRPADRMDEVEQVAHLIRQRIKSGACQPDDICVTYHNPELYLQRIAEIFPEHGIPYSMMEAHPLAQSPVVKAILACLTENAVPNEPPYFSAIEMPPREREMTPKAFQTYFTQLLEQGEVQRNILNSPDAIESAVISSEIAAYQALKELVDELRRSFDEPSETTHHYYQYVQWLRLMAAHTTYKTPETSGGVRIRSLSQLSQLQSLDFDTVILGDFTDGRFPTSYRPDALLPETHVRSESDEQCAQRFLFYRALKAFRERLYLISPARENESDLIPSPFLAQLEQVAKIGTEEVETTGEFSHVSFLRKYGQYVWETEAPAADFRDARWARTMPLVSHVALVEKSREETHNRLAYEGMLTARSHSALAERRVKPHSVTELETYAKCPFQYFAGRILALNAPSDDEEGLSALEKGILVHQMLFEFYTNRNGQQPNAANFAEAKRQLDEVIERATEEHRLRLSARQETAIGSDNLFWQIEKERLQIALHRWLEAERDADLPVLPRYFEVNIGEQKSGNADAALSSAQPISIGGVPLQAKIDRIDIGDGVFNVIDYKTGSSTTRIREICEGRALQLPIYLEIAKHLLQEKYRPAAGLYHKIRFDKCTVELGVGNEDDNDTSIQEYKDEVWKKVHSKNGQLVVSLAPVIQRVIGYVAHYVDEMCDGKFPLITRVKTFVDAVEDGSFPLTPRKKTEPCNYCSYKQMCRVGAVPETNDADA